MESNGLLFAITVVVIPAPALGLQRRRVWRVTGRAKRGVLFKNATA
jgi:hypothetical protein